MNKENTLMNLFEGATKVKPKPLEDTSRNIPKKIFAHTNQPQAIFFSTVSISSSLRVTDKHKDSILLKATEPSQSSLKRFEEGCLKTATTDHLNRLIQSEKELSSNITATLLSNRALNEEINKALSVNEGLLKEQDALAEQLRQLEQITESKQKTSALNISNLEEIKTQLQAQLERSSRMIKSIQDKRQLLTETTIQKNNQINMAQYEFQTLSEKELDIASIEKSLTSQIAQTEAEIKKAERKKYELILEVNRLQEKKREHNKSRLNTLSHILTLKPYYKKFLILRNSPSSIDSTLKLTINNHNAHTKPSFAIYKNRKNLQLNESLHYKYDYIISSISNPYEECLINESEYINNELVNIILPYTSQFNQGSDHKNCFVLYVSQLSYRAFNETIITLLNRVSMHFPEYSLNIRLQLKDVMVTLNKDIELEKQIDNVKEFPSAFVYELKDEKDVTKIWFCNVGFENAEISSILFKLNEQNQTKSLRKKAKTILYVNKEGASHLLKELNEFNPFYSLGVIDLNCEEVNMLNAHCVMNEL